MFQFFTCLLMTMYFRLMMVDLWAETCRFGRINTFIFDWSLNVVLY